jgi:phage replication O-like protein O
VPRNSKGFEIPNHTQTPNSFFDELLKQFKSLSEIKVVLAIVRLTFGWHKAADKISISQLQRLTGLSRESVTVGIKKALEHGLIERSPVGNSFIYRLKLVRNSDQSEVATGTESRPKSVGDPDWKIVRNSDPQKKAVKEKKESSAHSRLMKFHADRGGGKILDTGKQGKWVKRILEVHSEEDAIACYEWLLGETWCQAVDWSVVGGRIGPWMAKRSGTGAVPKSDPVVLEAKQRELAQRMGYEY